MKKTYTIFIRVILVLLINLFFLILANHIPMSVSSDVEMLASVISKVSPDRTYLEQVSMAESVLKLSGGNLQEAVKGLGVLTEPATSSARRAAKQAIINSGKYY